MVGSGNCFPDLSLPIRLLLQCSGELLLMMQNGSNVPPLSLEAPQRETAETS